MSIQRPTDAQPVGQFDFVGFNKKLGHRLVAWRPGYVEIVMEVRPDLMNASGVVHGGVLMTLLDAASGLSASFEGPDKPRKFCRTLSFTTQFINPGRAGMGGSEKPDLKAEFSATPHVRGTCSMARSQNPNSANSQFFICFTDAPWLNKQYSVWGQVIEGMDNIDKIKKGEPVSDPDSIVSMRVAADV